MTKHPLSPNVAPDTTVASGPRLDTQTRERVIGILVQSFGGDRPSAGVYTSYIRYFQQFGTVRLVTPDEAPGERKIDLLVLPGGPDVSSAVLSDDKVRYSSGSDNVCYTEFYSKTLSKWVEAGVPIFGICLGFQALMALVYGCKLIDHVAFHSGTEHYIKFKGISKVEHVVNSRHHQAISVNDPALLADSNNKVVFTDAYLEKEDKKTTVVEGSLLEAIYDATRRIGGVQYHPEDLYLDRLNPSKIGGSVDRSIVSFLLGVSTED